MTPVVLIGTNRETGDLKVIGLYEDEAAANRAVHTQGLPDAHYAIMTPPLNGYLQRREIPVDGLDVLVPMAEFKATSPEPAASDQA